MTRAAPLWPVILAPALAGAAGWTDLTGSDAAGEQIILRHVRTVTVQRLGHEAAYAQHVKADIIASSPGGGERRHAAQDCLHSTRPDGSGWLTCSPEGDSPLAGTTYHQAAPERDSVSPWTCFSHCSRRTPMVLTVTPARAASTPAAPGIVRPPSLDEKRP